MNKIIFDHQRPSSTLYYQQPKKDSFRNFFRNTQIVRNVAPRSASKINYHDQQDKQGKKLQKRQQQYSSSKPGVHRLNKNIRSSLNFLKNKAQSSIKNRTLTSKPAQISEINILEQNKQLFFLQTKLNMLQKNQKILESFGFLQTLQTFNKKTKTIQSAYSSEYLAERKSNHTQFIKNPSKNGKIVYMRRKRKNPNKQMQEINRIRNKCNKTENIQLSIERKTISHRQKSCSRMQQLSENSSKKILSSRINHRSHTINTTKRDNNQQQSGVKINFIKKQYPITPWE